MTTPYVTGTVSVTAGSAIVTGVGTGWQTAGLVAGVFGLDSANGNPIPVLSVDSDTQITLAKPWRGTTANAQPYWITYDTTPGQQTVANAQMLALYLSRLDKPALAALASLVPAADKLPYFGANGAGALADFNAAARALLAGGVLPDGQLPGRLRNIGFGSTDANAITDNGWYVVAGTASNIPIAQPGFIFHSSISASFAFQRYTRRGAIVTYERTMSSGVWSAWALVIIPILGTVSQSAGVPTGAIIERGSNANGEYVRFADGTQICTIREVVTTTVTSAVGALYFSGAILARRTYPVAFVSAPNDNLVISGPLNAIIGSQQVATATQTGAYYHLSDTPRASQSYTYEYTAIGRWF